MTDFRYLSSDLEALAGLENYYRWIFEEIRPFLGSRLAEVGAGIGTFSDILASGHLRVSQAPRLTVFEPAVNLHPRLLDNLQRNHPALMEGRRLIVQNGYFSLYPREFDTVIMINVLEHIEDDAGVVRTVFDSLSPGGSLVLFVPALEWLMSDLDRAVGHYRRYEKHGLEKLLQKEGFEVVKNTYFDFLGIAPWYLFYVLGRSRSVTPRAARLYDRWGVPLTRWLERFLPPVVGKSLLMVGRKPLPPPAAAAQPSDSHAGTPQ
jgi:SAM-dependent methyltransferase